MQYYLRSDNAQCIYQSLFHENFKSYCFVKSGKFYGSVSMTYISGLRAASVKCYQILNGDSTL